MPPAPKSNAIRNGLDQEALLKMIEPLTLHVVRMQGNQRETIPLPIRQGYDASGVGWTISDVKDLEQEIVGISGGGAYEAQVSDSAQEAQTTKWSFVLPTSVYPMHPPTTLAPSGGFGGAPGYATAPPSRPTPFSGYPGHSHAHGGSTSIPGFGGAGAGQLMGSNGAPASPWPQPNASTQIPPWWAQPHLPPQPGRGPVDYQTELHKQELARQEERHRHEKELAEVQRQFAAVAAAPKTDDRAERLERQLVEMQAATRAAEERRAAEDRARLDREAQQREAAERQRLADENLRRIEAAMAEDRRRADEKFAAVLAQMSQLATAVTSRPAGPDPMLMMMFESQKAQADAQREAARISAEADRETARLRADVEKENARAQVEAARINAESQQRLVTTVQAIMAPNQMSPMDAARVVREASQAGDQVTRTMLTSMTEMLGIQREFTANMLQMAPQGEGVAGKVVDAIQDVAKTFSQGQAQVAAAQAHAAAQMAQAQRPQAPMAPPASDPGLAGPPAGGAVITPPPTYVPDANPHSPGGALPADTQAPQTEPVLRNGKTDAQWFGPALADVNNLRGGVKLYLDAIAGDDVTLHQPDNEPITVVNNEHEKKTVGVSPLLAARVLIMAATEIRTKQIPGVEAFTYLYEQGMHHALLEVVLPDAPVEYRVDVLRFLNRLLTGGQLVQVNDTPMYGIDAFLGDDDVEPPTSSAQPQPEMVIPPPVARQPVPVGRQQARPNGRGR